MVWEVSQAVNIPIIGMGGIMSAGDAIEFILVGASAIQIGTANLTNPRTAMEVIQGIEKYLARNKINCIQKLIGAFG
jgi:dihydroorotate dehydrogenase (NAD+) catalytic subunit